MLLGLDLILLAAGVWGMVRERRRGFFVPISGKSSNKRK